MALAARYICGVNKKCIIIAAAIVCLAFNAISQSRSIVKKESLKGIQFVSEITPILWPKMWLPLGQRNALDQLARSAYSESFIYSNKYNTVIDYESVDIIATCYGKTLTAQSKGDVLTTEQKNLLNMADAGTELKIRIRFRFKSNKASSSDISKDVVEGFLVLVVLPEMEAEYPGGYLQIAEFFKKSLKERTSEKPKNASIIFTVNEDGVASNARIGNSSGSKTIDKLLLEAITNMPKWKPAKNSKGVAVKQEFHVMLGTQLIDGC